MNGEKIRILIVDDHAVLRTGLRTVIGYAQDMEVIGEASDGIEAVMLARRLHPDVILMDLLMPNKDGIEAINDIRREKPDTRILVLTSATEMDIILLAVKSGAQGYILKNAPPNELLRSIRDVYRGAVSFQPIIARELFHRLQTTGFDEVPTKVLTDRELEILKLVAQGLSNDQIAEQLIISKRTVNVHMTNILGKLSLANRAQAVLYALRNGLVSLFTE